MIQITESAQSKIKEVLEDESPETALRMYVTGGGCSGFQYGFSMEEGMNDDDSEIPAGSTTAFSKYCIDNESTNTFVEPAGISKSSSFIPSSIEKPY